MSLVIEINQDERRPSLRRKERFNERFRLRLLVGLHGELFRQHFRSSYLGDMVIKSSDSTPTGGIISDKPLQSMARDYFGNSCPDIAEHIDYDKVIELAMTREGLREKIGDYGTKFWSTYR